MMALTLWMPWAALMAAGVKQIENRPWMPPPSLMGQRFALHAGKFYDESADTYIDELMSAKVGDPSKELLPPSWPEHPLRSTWRNIPHRSTPGVVLAVATLVNVVDHGMFPSELERVFEKWPDQRRWFFGRCGWVLDDIRPIARPIACVGRQKLWTLPAHVEQQVCDQLPA